MAKQGKCIRCRIRYTWDKDIPLKLLHCEVCGEPLKNTPHSCSKTERLDVSAITELMEGPSPDRSEDD